MNSIYLSSTFINRYFGEKVMFLVVLGKTYDVSPYDSKRSHPSMDLGVKWDFRCVLFAQTAVNCQDCKFVWAKLYSTVSCSNKMLQRLAVTNPNDKMDPHGVNPTFSIFLPTPFLVATQGLGATAPLEKDLRIPCLEIIVFTNWKTGIGLSKECYQKWNERLSCLTLIVLTIWKTGIGLSKSVLSKKRHKILEDCSSYIKIKIRMLKGLSIGQFQSWQKVGNSKLQIGLMGANTN